MRTDLPTSSCWANQRIICRQNRKWASRPSEMAPGLSLSAGLIGAPRPRPIAPPRKASLPPLHDESRAPLPRLLLVNLQNRRTIRGPRREPRGRHVAEDEDVVMVLPEVGTALAPPLIGPRPLVLP